MIEKLELKHLAGYLPHKLKIQSQSGNGDYDYKGRIKELTLFNAHLVDGTKYKPILHPLSDLTKPCLEDGKIPIVELLKIQESDYISSQDSDSRYLEITVDDEGWPYAYFTLMATKAIMIRTFDMTVFALWIIEKLFEWHFDMYGLIDSDLAIDIN